MRKNNNKNETIRKQIFPKTRLREAGKAPYNFVSLNKIIKENKVDWNHSTFNSKLFSGSIDIDLTALTPIFTRGYLQQNANELDNSHFFGTEINNPMIPGSTLRGLLASMVQIISDSAITNVEDQKFFYRNIGFAYYSKNFIQGSPRVKAGWLRKEGSKYTIKPSIRFNRQNNGKYNFLKVEVDFISDTKPIESITKQSKDRNNNNYGDQLNVKEGDFLKVYIDPYSIDEKNRSGFVWEVYRNKEDDYIKCCLIASGQVEGKKHQTIIGMPDKKAKEIDVTKYYKEYYNNNKNRDVVKNINEKLDSLPTEQSHIGVPIFYKDIVLGDSSITAFGDTPVFRIPYAYTTHQFVKQENIKGNDMLTDVFGSTQKSSKLFVNNLEFIEETGQPKAPELTEILASPKPTYFPNYLQQDGFLTHYDIKDAIIRGNKMYWHCEGKRYQCSLSEEEQIEKKDVLNEKVCVYSAGSTFTGNLRFENLSKEQLGCLLFILNLEDSLAYKIGYGKPLGLGSCTIKYSKLNLHNKTNRYTSIFSNNTWNEGIENIVDCDDFVRAFTKWKHGDENKNLWDASKRMMELKRLLTFKRSNNDWISRTRYLSIDEREYRNHPYLKSTLEY